MNGVNLGWPIWIAVVCRDLEAQRRFYEDLLGFDQLDQGEGWIQFALGQGRMLELIARVPGRS
jgi:catechol 2,3-dioxygenase-like lactoylglutathione lyase family enzyme